MTELLLEGAWHRSAAVAGVAGDPHGRIRALAEVGLPQEEIPTALLAFNVGVELGQLGVIALAAVVLGAWVKLGRDRLALVRPASILIAATGLYWFVQRVFF